MSKKHRAIIITIVLISCHLLIWLGGVSLEDVGIMRGGHWWSIFTYHFAHANIFHLTLNILCLYALLQHDLKRFHLWSGFVIAILAGLLAAKDIPTVGCSAYILALSGIISSWGASGRSIILTLLMLAIFCIIPNTNGAIHLFAWSGGFILGRFRIAYLRYQYDRKGNHIRK